MKYQTSKYFNACFEKAEHYAAFDKDPYKAMWQFMPRSFKQWLLDTYPDVHKSLSAHGFQNRENVKLLRALCREHERNFVPTNKPVSFSIGDRARLA